MWIVSATREGKPRFLSCNPTNFSTKYHHGCTKFCVSIFIPYLSVPYAGNITNQLKVISSMHILITYLLHQAIMSAAEEKPCGAVSADINKRQFAGIAACSKSMKFKNGKDKAKKQTVSSIAYIILILL